MDDLSEYGVIEDGEIHPWGRMNGEPHKWFVRFNNFRLMGPSRSILACYNGEKVGRGGKKGHHVTSSWQTQSDSWKWRERAEAWDLWQISQKDEAEKAKIKSIRDKELELVQKIVEKAEQMLAFPLQTITREEKDVNGHVVTVNTIIPSKWVLRDAAGMLSAVSTLLNVREGVRTKLDVDTSGNQVVKFDLSELPTDVLRAIANGTEQRTVEDDGTESVGGEKPD